MKLKTLKDIFEHKDYSKADDWGIGAKSALFELKQEAIRWIKEFNKSQLEVIDEFYTSYQSIDAIVLWIKHFFNITEKDLKWQKKIID